MCFQEVKLIFIHKVLQYWKDFISQIIIIFNSLNVYIFKIILYTKLVINIIHYSINYNYCDDNILSCKNYFYYKGIEKLNLFQESKLLNVQNNSLII